MIDISKADTALVLLRLVNQAESLGADARPETIEFIKALLPITYEQAERMVHGNLDLDYIGRQLLGLALGQPIIDERRYDRDNGPGAARRALQGVAGVEFLTRKT